jgi:uncharacterized protein YqeY
MSLKETIDQDIKAAMRAKDQTRLLTLRAIKASILLAETAEGKTEHSINQDEELALLAREAKQRRESMNQFLANDRPDLAEKEEKELAVIEEYLPKPLSPEELEAAVRKAIADLGATSMKDMGRVMGVVTKALLGKAEGSAISQIVKKLLGA